MAYVIRRAGRSGGSHMLGGFVAWLLQGFENRRLGLSDEVLRSGDAAVEGVFGELYQQEVPRLQETVRLFESGLSEGGQRDIFATVDGLVRGVALPAFARVARRFTLRERNDFYLVPEGLRGLERFVWAVAGLALGAFVVWAPFVPIWQKEWVLVFVAGGLFFPDIRRTLARRRYQADLGAIVARVDDEIRRTELAHLESAAGLGAAPRAGGAAPLGADLAPAAAPTGRAKARH